MPIEHRPVPVAVFFPDHLDFPQVEPPQAVLDRLGQNPTYLVFNAARPLYGVEWQGAFRRGVWYAAVSLDGDDYERSVNRGFILRNLQLDAAVCARLSDAVMDARFNQIALGLEARLHRHIDPTLFDWTDRFQSIQQRQGTLSYVDEPGADDRLLAAVRFYEANGYFPETASHAADRIWNDRIPDGGITIEYE